MNWSILPLAIYGLLNTPLFILAPRQARGAWGAAAGFALAALCVLLGLWQTNTVLVLLGLAFSLAAPVWMGFLLHGKPKPAHHLVRAAVVAVCFGLWISFRPS